MPRKAQKGVSIIVPASATARDTLLRTRSLLRYSPADREIIIVDNSLPPEQLMPVKQFVDVQPAIRLFHYDDKPDLATMYNRAARKADRPSVLFVLSDLRIDATATGILERMMERALTAGIGAVGCLILDKNKTVLHAGVFKRPDEPFATLYGGHRLATVIRKLGSRTYPYDPRRSRPVLAVAGALMISQANFRMIGGFREKLALTPSALQVELCLRANQAERQTWLVGGGHLVGKEMIRDLQPSPDMLKRLDDVTDEWSPDAPPMRQPQKLRLPLPWRR